MPINPKLVIQTNNRLKSLDVNFVKAFDFKKSRFETAIHKIKAIALYARGQNLT